MSYQGGPPSGPGYGYSHVPPGSFQPSARQQPYAQNIPPRTAWDGTSPVLGIPQMQQMNQVQQMQQIQQMQQMQGIQAHNQNAYYQQQQYSPVSSHPVLSSHIQPPVQTPQHYTQFASHQQQPLLQYNRPPSTHVQLPNLPQYHMAELTQQPAQRCDIPVTSSNVKVQVSRNHENFKSLSKTSPSSRSEGQPVDKQMLLTALAEEYFTAAHKLGPTVAQTMSEDIIEEYQSLIATGLGCLEASFKKMRLAPRMEAKVRLRYASVLYEETENYMEAETALSQGIILCEQNRYLDLKYSMQVLLAQLVYVKNPRASLKSLDRHCSDTEAYRHNSWEYVFRFLKASLSLKTKRALDAQAAIHDLRHMSSIANNRGDHAIFLLSSLMEIIAHLTFPTPESVEQVQTALAAAWTYQTEAGGKTPQLLVLTHILDVTCSLLYGLPAQTEPKQKAMEEAFKNSGWSTSTNSGDIFAIPIKSSPVQTQLVSPDTRGILGTSEEGKETLMVSFLNNNDTFALIYLLSGVALLHNNCTDGKATQYFRQGLSSVHDSNKSQKGICSLPGVVMKSRWRDMLSCYFLAYIVFCSASSSDWKAAKQGLELLEKAIPMVDDATRGPLAQIHIYLSGVCCQGTGDLSGALSMFRDPKLRLPGRSAPSARPEEQLQQELALLASLNSLWIQQADPHHDPAQNATMIAKMEPFCAKHQNKDIETAFKLVKATVPTDPPTSGVKTKGYLGSALEAARATSNKQFLCITLSVMCSRFFVGVVGTQADKAGKAAAHQAKRARNTLWMSVTNGMLGQNLELQGKHGEAQATKDEAKRLAALAFPEPPAKQ